MLLAVNNPSDKLKDFCDCTGVRSETFKVGPDTERMYIVAKKQIYTAMILAVDDQVEVLVVR